MLKLLQALTVVGIFAAWGRAVAAEPNETFATRTLLPAGVLSASDSLTAGTGNFPDTLLGIRGTFGGIAVSDDNGSPVGDGLASGLAGVPTNSGSIEFAVAGYPDFSFGGNHAESGQYRVFVDVYDFFGDPVNQFSEVRTLQSGAVDEFSYFDGNWIGGSYDAYIDNTLGPIVGGDVDFFTFQGLTPGATFSAETKSPLVDTFDTVLAWFNDAGTQVAFDDDGGENYLSLLAGTVPASGKLTFAVSGFGDDGLTGSHLESGAFQLVVATAVALPADFTGDGLINGADLTRWKTNFGLSAGALKSQGDANADGRVSGADFLAWQRGAAAAVAATGAVPEPMTPALAVLAAALGGRLGRAPRRRRLA